ncbi:MAG: AAA family ATPase [Spirochaetota bacterium]
MDLRKFEKLDVVLVCGLPSSGKSHFARKFFIDSGRKRVNRKEIRRLLYEMTSFGNKWSESMFSHVDENLVKHTERKVIEQLMVNNEKVLIDNTSVTVDSRKRYVATARRFNKSIGVIFLNTPVLLCLERNQGKEDSVPGTVISNLSAALAFPTKDEGFAEILVIDDY